MRRTLLIAGLVAAVAAPSFASAESCAKRAHDRRMTGTVVGGIGGALIGNAITRDSTGAILGGLGGAVAGNQIARTSCDRPHYSSRARTRTYRSSERYEIHLGLRATSNELRARTPLTETFHTRAGRRCRSPGGTR